MNYCVRVHTKFPPFFKYETPAFYGWGIGPAITEMYEKIAKHPDLKGMRVYPRLCHKEEKDYGTLHLYYASVPYWLSVLSENKNPNQDDNLEWWENFFHCNLDENISHARPILNETILNGLARFGGADAVIIHLSNFK